MDRKKKTDQRSVSLVITSDWEDLSSFSACLMCSRKINQVTCKKKYYFNIRNGIWNKSKFLKNRMAAFFPGNSSCTKWPAEARILWFFFHVGMVDNHKFLDLKGTLKISNSKLSLLPFLLWLISLCHYIPGEHRWNPTQKRLPQKDSVFWMFAPRISWSKCLLFSHKEDDL